MYLEAVLDLLLVTVVTSHVLYAPYTKVEESFNLHATHDILFYGITPSSLSKFDHLEFPGAVPRSFIGSLLLSAIVAPILLIVGPLRLIGSKHDVQLLVRVIMGLLNATGLCLLRRATTRRFGRETGVVFMLLSTTQYHLPFWMGRTLPNMFALLPVNCALYFWIDYVQPDSIPGLGLEFMIGLVTFAAVVFRAELALLLFPMSVQLLVMKPNLISRLLRVGILSGFTSMVFTIAIDSYFWDTWPVWPELNGVIFNVLKGKSADWGVSPVHAYFTIHLPRMLLGVLPLCLVGLLGDKRCRLMLTPCIIFIALMSCLGHKEWRFIVYTVPVFNICASRGVTFTFRKVRGQNLKCLTALVVSGVILLNLLATLLFTQASHLNYPGGQALRSIHRLIPGKLETHLHLDNLSVQTGASLFMQEHNLTPTTLLASISSSFGSQNWTYDRSERITDFSGFSHVVCEDVEFFLPQSVIAAVEESVSSVSALSSPTQEINIRSLVSNWQPLAVSLGFDGWRWGLHFPVVVPKVAIKLWVLAKSPAERQ